MKNQRRSRKKYGKRIAMLEMKGKTKFYKGAFNIWDKR